MINFKSIKSDKITGFLMKSQETIVSAAFILAITSGINAVLGLVKGRLLTYYFGVSNDLAVFYTADRIPNLVYSILIVGAVSTVFIPVFADLLKKDREEAHKIASTIINATFLFFVILGGFVFAFSPRIIDLVALGEFSPEEIKLGSNLMRLMLASQLILVAGSLTTSVLQTFKKFLIPAFAPVAYSIGMIFGIIFLSPKIGIYGPAIGVLIGSVLHLFIQIPVLKSTDFKFSFSLDFKAKKFRATLSLIPPRILSVLAANAVQTISNSLAILISKPSVIFLKYANQLQSMPINLFGISIASACLPTLSSETGPLDKRKFKQTFTTSFLQMMFLVMPLSIILLILRVPIVRIVYGVSNFPWEATLKTSRALGYFSISIFAQSAYYLVSRAFYAKKDTKTPLIVTLLTAVLSIGLSWVFVEHFKFDVWSIALAYSITSILEMFILLFILDQRLGGFDFNEFVIPLAKISTSTILMGFTLYFPMKFLDQFVFDTTRSIQLLALTVIVGIVGSGTYVLFTWLFKVKEITLLYKLLRKVDFSKKVLTSENVIYSAKEKENL